MNRLVLTTGAAAAALLAGAASAQTMLQTLTGASASDQMGDSVAIVGDVDADGYADVGVGVPYADVGGVNAGSIRVVSGRTGANLYVFHGLVAGDRLGESIAPAGDVNNDGFADFVAGAPLNDQNGVSAGMARVWSGRDGAALYTWFGDQAGDWFGAAVDNAGDVNNDGRSDVIVGAPFGKGTSTSNIGEARIFSGLNGSVIRTHNSPQGVSVLGQTVSGAGDVNQDGWDDVIIGAPQAGYSATDSGRAWVFSGKTGAVLYTWDGVGHGSYFAQCVDGGNDVNNDGWPDLVVGTPFHDYNGGNSGTVHVYSGKTGVQLYRFDGTASGDELGRACAIVGDVDGDGFADVGGGAKFKDQIFPNAGMVRIWSGRTGQAIFSLYGSAIDDQMGHAVTGRGDVNGDGLDDVMIGWPTFDTNILTLDTGRAQVWAGTPYAVTTYCTGTTNSAGCVGTVSTTGTPSILNPLAFNIRATQVTNQKSGLMFFGRHGQQAPYMGGFLCVQPPIIRTAVQSTGGSATGVNCSGTMTYDMNGWFDQHAGVMEAGDTLYAQYYYRDGSNVEWTNAVLFTVQP